jgi:uncharacterized membrane protein YoaK (UPF0700 family)
MAQDTMEPRTDEVGNCTKSVGSRRMISIRSPSPNVPAPSVHGSLSGRLLVFILSMTAGSADIIGFLGLGGLFTAHITGNIVILAAKLVVGEKAPLSYLIAVPVFAVALALARLLAAASERLQVPSLVPLLLLQFWLLAGLHVIGLAGGPVLDPNAAVTTVAGMLGVTAMAVQNVLVRTSLRDAPATAVMTTNITVFTIDVGEIWLGRGSSGIAAACARAGRTWPAIIGFLLGCGLGAGCEAGFGLRALALPACLALLALALGVPASVPHPEAGT